MKVHTTQDGRRILLRDMSDEHLTATIRMMERKAKIGVIFREGGGGPEPQSYWYSDETLYGTEALKRMGYGDYIAERQRREAESKGATMKTITTICDRCGYKHDSQKSSREKNRILELRVPVKNVVAPEEVGYETVELCATCRSKLELLIHEFMKRTLITINSTAL